MTTTPEPVEAYEEDWYRSLRALAERQHGPAEPYIEEGEPELDVPGEERDRSEVAEQEPENGSAELGLPPGLAGETGHDDEDSAPVAAELVDPGADRAREPEAGAEPSELEAVGAPDGSAPLPAGAIDEVAPGWSAGLAADVEAPELPETPTIEPEETLLGAEEQAHPAVPSGLEAQATGADPAILGPTRAEDEASPRDTSIPAPEAFEEESAEPAGPSLTSADPRERRLALEELATQDLSDSDVEHVAALLFDPDAEIRLMALETIARRPDRVDRAVIMQALQDPADEVRAGAVELAVRRGPHDLSQLVPLLAVRSWPLTHETVLRRLPEVIASTTVDDQTFRHVLEAVGEMEPGPGEGERSALTRLAHALDLQRIMGSLASPDTPRLGAVRLLADDRSPAVLRALASQGGDPLEEIRAVAATAIAELTEAQADTSAPQPTADDRATQTAESEGDRIASLARALQDDDATVRHLALSGLAGMDRGAIVAWVHDTIRAGDAAQLALAAATARVLRLIEGAGDILDAAAELPADARHSLVEALTSFVMPPDQLATLLPQVRESVRAEAIRMLWQVGGPPLLSHLRAYLDDPSDAVRGAVLEAFGESRDPGGVDVARVILETDVSPDVRAHAVRVLARAGGTPAATVVRALSDPDPDVRAIAIESLPDVEGVEGFDVLVSSLSDPDDRVRKAAAKRLASRGDDPELVWSALRQAPAAGRGEIIGSFEAARPGALTQVALRRLRSPEQDERILAVEVAGWGAGPGCIEAAIQALQDPAAPVRRTAAVALGRLRDAAAANALGKALGDPDPEVRVGVVRALGVIDDEAVLGFLVSALNDPDGRVRDVTSQVLTEWSSPAVARRLAGVLAVPSLREAATDLLTRIGAPAVELLIEVLMQHNPAVVPTVGQLLRQISEPGEFVSRLEAVEPERRLRGVEALGAIGGPAAADALLRSVSDPDERIRARAAQLLADLRDPRAREVLENLARDPVPGVVAAAHEALSRLGADGDRAA